MKEKTGHGEIESLLHHKFAQPELLTRALTHRSLAYENKLADPEFVTSNDPTSDNEQLEFLGDAVVGFLVADDLCRRYPDLREGELPASAPSWSAASTSARSPHASTSAPSCFSAREKSAAEAAKKTPSSPIASKP